VKPIRLAANRFPRFYRGGPAIDELRGTTAEAGAALLPEDWVGSATTACGWEADGLTGLEDGRTLRAEGPDAVVHLGFREAMDPGRLGAVRCLPPTPEAGPDLPGGAA
jgi:hypothetical protein